MRVPLCGHASFLAGLKLTRWRAEAELSKRVVTRGPRPGANATKDLGESSFPG